MPKLGTLSGLSNPFYIFPSSVYPLSKNSAYSVTPYVNFFVTLANHIALDLNLWIVFRGKHLFSCASNTFCVNFFIIIVTNSPHTSHGYKFLFFPVGVFENQMFKNIVSKTNKNKNIASSWP